MLFLFSRQISRHFPHSPALQYRQNRERPPFPNLSGGAAHVGHAGPLASGGADRSQPTPAPKGIRSRTSGGTGGIHPPPWDHPAPVRPPLIYCKDGVRKSAITANGNTTYTEIDEETLNNFFDSINKTNAEQELDWNSLLEDADLKDYIDTTKIDAVSNSLKNTFENGNGKEALGIKESAVDNGTKYSFDINTYKTISIIVDEIEPLFKDKSKYNELKNELPEAESYLNSINLKFDITVDNAGYLSGFAFNSFGTKIDFSISKIGNTKVELSESEINDIKNAKATPTTGYIPDKYYDGDNAVDDINQVYDFT